MHPHGVARPLVAALCALLVSACTDDAIAPPHQSPAPATTRPSADVAPAATLGGSAGLLIAATGLAFGDVQTGSISAAQNVTVTNVGLVATALTGTGGAPGGAFGMTQSCEGATLAAGASCAMAFTFSPSADGAATATSAGTWNGQPYTVALSGTGVPERILIETTALDFGDVPVGATSAKQMVNVTNIGLASVVISGSGGAPGGSFVATQNCQATTLAPGASCQLSVDFRPTDEGVATGQSSGSFNGQSFDIALSGRGIAPRFQVVPAGFDFGEVQVGTSSPMLTADITNIGTVPVVMSGAGGAPGGAFSATQNCQAKTLAPGASCQMFFVFNPTATGAASGQSAGSWNGQQFDIPLSGTGIAAGASPTAQFRIVTRGLDFGDVPVGATSASQTVDIVNIGPDPVVMSGAGGAPGGSFVATQNCQANTLAPGEACQMFFDFRPTAGGAATGQSSGNWNGQSFDIALSGRGIAPRFQLTPAGIDFGDVQIGAPVTRTLDLTNIGPAPVVMSGAGGAPGGAFSVTQNCQAKTLAPGASCQMLARFTPTATGVASGQSSVSWNGQDFDIPLTGNGVLPKLLVTPVGFDFGNVALFTTSPAQSTTVTNVGVAPITMAGVGGTVSLPFGFSQSCDATTLAVGASCAMTYTFAPSILGAAATTSSGTWNAQPFSVALGGIGVTPYTFRGFLANIAAFPALNIVTAGSTMPLKFSLGGNFGLGIFAPGSPASVAIACGSTAPATATEATLTPKREALTYDARSDVYTYPWKTEKRWMGTCRQFVLTLKDRNEYRVNVLLR